MEDLSQFFGALDHSVVLCVDMVGGPSFQDFHPLELGVEQGRKIAVADNVVPLCNFVLPPAQYRPLPETTDGRGVHNASNQRRLSG